MIDFGKIRYLIKGYFGDKAPPLLNGEDYQITSIVGKGGYGDVYLALNKIDTKHYVMKLDNGRNAPYEIYAKWEYVLLMVKIFKCPKFEFIFRLIFEFIDSCTYNIYAKNKIQIE